MRTIAEIDADRFVELVYELNEGLHELAKKTKSWQAKSIYSVRFFHDAFDDFDAAFSYSMRYFHLEEALVDKRFAAFVRSCDDARCIEIHEAVIRAAAVYDTQKGLKDMLAVANRLAADFPSEVPE